MAAVTIRVRSGKGVIVVYMTVRAGHDFARWRQLVRSQKRPARSGVVKHHIGPRRRVVTSRAVRCGEGRSSAWVRRVICRLPSGQMALRISAICRRYLQIVIVVDVTRSAARHLACWSKLVRIRQRETGRAVIESRGKPRNRGVAHGAICHRKGIRGGRMIRIGRLLPRCQMALRIAAIGGGDLQIVVVIDVAGRARNIRVAIDQQKTGCTVIESCSQPAIE